MTRHGWTAAVVAAGLAISARGADDLGAFPAPEPGMVRHVVRLPPLPDEAAHRVELSVGKTVRTDAANRYFFGGRIDSGSIAGWGYTRYVVRELGPMAGTRMAVDPEAPQVERFIALGGEPFLIRYNSRLPVVVYVPGGAEVRYRIWSAEEAFHPMGAE